MLWNYISVLPSPPFFMDELNNKVENRIGPYHDGDTLLLRCLVIGGKWGDLIELPERRYSESMTVELLSNWRIVGAGSSTIYFFYLKFMRTFGGGLCSVVGRPVKFCFLGFFCRFILSYLGIKYLRLKWALSVGLFFILSFSVNKRVRYAFFTVGPRNIWLDFNKKIKESPTQL